LISKPAIRFSFPRASYACQRLQDDYPCYSVSADRLCYYYTTLYDIIQVNITSDTTSTLILDLYIIKVIDRIAYNDISLSKASPYAPLLSKKALKGFWDAALTSPHRGPKRPLDALLARSVLISTVGFRMSPDHYHHVILQYVQVCCRSEMQNSCRQSDRMFPFRKSSSGLCRLMPR